MSTSPSPASTSSSSSSSIAIFAVIALLVAGGSFYGGMRYERSHAATNRGASAMRGGAGLAAGGFARGGATGMAGGARGGAFGNAAQGEILSKDATGLTLKLADGGSKVVLTTSSTAIAKTETGSASDLTAGTPVFVSGTANSDGSLTATTIQIRPPMPMGGMRPRGAASTTEATGAR